MVFISVDRNGKLVSAITKNGKNGHSSRKMHPGETFKYRPPLKFGSPVFQVLTEMENWCQPLQKMEKNGRSSPKTCPRAKLPIADPPKV